MKKSKVLLVLLLITIISLCSVQETSAQEKSIVYFTRPPLIGGAVGFRFYDSDSYLGKTKFGQYIKYECEPGNHTFGLLIKDIIATQTTFLAVDLKAGETYYFNASMAPMKEIKAAKSEAKALKKAGKEFKKPSYYKLVNIENETKLLSKVKSKIGKKPPMEFSEEDLQKGELAFAEVIAKELSLYKTENSSIVENTPVNNTEVSSLAQASISSLAAKPTSESKYSEMTIVELETEKEKAISSENYLLANTIKQQIKVKQDAVSSISSSEVVSDSSAVAVSEKVEATETTGLSSLVSTSKKTTSLSSLINKREIAYKSFIEGGSVGLNTIVSNNSGDSKDSQNSANRKTKISKSDTNKTESGIKYRRSSLYTLMIKDDSRDHTKTIKNTFGDFEIPEKFNDHNVGPYLINSQIGEKDQSKNITSYLKTNDIAKQMVAKWFNRSSEGGFNMDLISERGSYSASDLDIKLAKNNERGLSIIADAGEELINNTFVIINDYKFTNKEKVAKKAGGFLKALSQVASYAGYSSISNIATYTNAGLSIVGKGYVIKTTAYLYKLVWDEKTAAIFYNDYWNEDGSIDQTKKEAFDKSDLFKLKLVGAESALADLQSTIFTKKSEEGLIEIATVKATDKTIAKLQRKFEAFRTKSPLLSGDPISAKIGLKEGLSKGDKYEVLEQVINKKGVTEYKRVGVVKVDKNHIWDNRYMAEEGKKSSLEYTTFSGAKNKFFTGMLIRQIN